MPKGEDPDTYIHGHGPEALEKILDEAVPLADYHFSSLTQRFGMSLEGKSQIAGEVSRLLTKVNNPIDVDLLVRRAVDTLGVREEVLRRPIVTPGYSLGSKMIPKALSATPSPIRDDIAERSLVSLMLRFPAVLRAVEKEGEARQWLSSKWQAVVDLILAEWQERRQVDVFRVRSRHQRRRRLRRTAAAEARRRPDRDRAQCRLLLRGLVGTGSSWPGRRSRP